MISPHFCKKHFLLMKETFILGNSQELIYRDGGALKGRQFIAQSNAP
jgi:hypothetical protein